MTLRSFLFIVSYLSLSLTNELVASANSLATVAAFEAFDYKDYAKSAGLDENHYSKSQLWGLFKEDKDLTHKPNSWFHPNQYQCLFPKEDPVSAYKVYVNFFKQGLGIRERGHNDMEEIISLTTHGNRIDTAWLAIDSILRQERKAHRVILWLYKGDYPALYKDRSNVLDSKYLPASLRHLMARGLEIQFTKKDYKVATKLLPALEAFPRACITTIDDDRIYSPLLTQALWTSHESHPSCIVSPHVRAYVTYPQNGGINYLAQDVVYPDDGSPIQQGPYGPCIAHYGPPLFGIFEGFSGVFYPPHALGSKVISDFFPLFGHLTPCADDVWYQTHAILNGTKCVGLPQELGDAIFNPQEIEGTQISGLWRRHLDANSYMADKAFWYYGIFDKLGISFDPHVLCQSCRRTVPMVGPGEAFPRPSSHKGSECKRCLNQDQKTLLVVGAGGYGNVGDNLYPLIFDHYLKNNFRIICAPDTVRVAKDGTFMELEDPRPDMDFDALIVGGGGILKDLRKSALRHHIAHAINGHKPLIFASVGLQTTLKNPTPSDVRHILTFHAPQASSFLPSCLVGSSSESSSSSDDGQDTTTSSPSSHVSTDHMSMLTFLESAHLIFARTPMDARLLQSVLSPGGASRVRYYPDLGYLAPNALSIPQDRRKKYITLIPTGSVHTGQQMVQNHIQQLLAQHQGAKLLVMNWGGPRNPTQVKSDPDRLLVEKAKQDFPSAKVFYGDTVSREIKKLRYQHKTIAPCDLTPPKALKKIAQSHHVITGRLHGQIIAKAMGIPVTSMDFSYKLTAQHDVIPDHLHAQMALTHLTHFLEHAGVSLMSPSLWSDTHRNDMILRTQGITGMAIPVIQQYDNQQIHDFLAFGIIPTQDPHALARFGAFIPIPSHPSIWQDERNTMIVQVNESQTGHKLSQIQSLTNETLFYLLSLKPHFHGDVSQAITYFFAHKGMDLKDPSSWSDGDRDARINMVHKKDKSLPIDFIQAMDNVTLYKFLAFNVHPLHG